MATCLVVITMLTYFIMVVMNDYVGVCAGLRLLMTASDALSSCDELYHASVDD